MPRARSSERVRSCIFGPLGTDWRAACHPLGRTFQLRVAQGPWYGTEKAGQGSGASRRALSYQTGQEFDLFHDLHMLPGIRSSPCILSLCFFFSFPSQFLYLFSFLPFLKKIFAFFLLIILSPEFLTPFSFSSVPLPQPLRHHPLNLVSASCPPSHLLLPFFLPHDHSLHASLNPGVYCGTVSLGVKPKLDHLPSWMTFDKLLHPLEPQFANL